MYFLFSFRNILSFSTMQSYTPNVNFWVTKYKYSSFIYLFIIIVYAQFKIDTRKFSSFFGLEVNNKPGKLLLNTCWLLRKDCTSWHYCIHLLWLNGHIVKANNSWVAGSWNIRSYRSIRGNPRPCIIAFCGQCMTNWPLNWLRLQVPLEPPFMYSVFTSVPIPVAIPCEVCT
jgi:hypothetical protein